MRINEVITEAGLLGKIGKGLGKVAIAPVRALDKLAGGTGEVGTASQKADYRAGKLEKQKQKVKIANQTAVSQAYERFEHSLRSQGVVLNDPRTYNENLKDMLHAFANYYYGSDYSTGPVIQKEINKLPLPTQLNPGTIKKYLDDAGNIFVGVTDNLLSYQLAQSKEQAAKAQAEKEKAAQEKTAQQPQQSAGPKLAPGVTAVSTDPVILRYGKRDYYIADDGMWHEMNNRTPVDDAWQQFFDKQAELVEPQRQVIQRPAASTAPVVKPQPQSRPSPVARSQPTPAEIRQQKQAAATRQVQRQMKPKITVRPGETLDQAMARTRASRA